MIHLFKHDDGKFDIALVVNGKYIVGSNQHYENLKGVQNAIMAISKSCGVNCAHYQDDTRVKPVIVYMVVNLPTKKIIVDDTNLKPKKKYITYKYRDTG